MKYAITRPHPPMMRPCYCISFFMFILNNKFFLILLLYGLSSFFYDRIKGLFRNQGGT